MGQLGNGVYSSVQTYQQDMTTGIRKIPPPEITGTSLILGVAKGITNLRDAFTTRDFNCMKINLFFGPRILGHEDFPSKRKIYGFNDKKAP